MNNHHGQPIPPRKTPLCAVYEPMLALLALDELDAAQSASARAHLAGCPYCQQRLRETERSIAAVRHELLDHLLVEGTNVRGVGAIPTTSSMQMHESSQTAARGDPQSRAPIHLTMRDILAASAQAQPTAHAGDARTADVQRPVVLQHPNRLLSSLGAIAAVLLLALLAASLFRAFRAPSGPAVQPTPTIQRAFVPYTAAAPGLPCDTNAQASALWSGDQGICLQNPAGTRLVAQGRLAAEMRWANTTSLPDNYKISVQVTLEGASTAKLLVENSFTNNGYLIECSPNHCDFNGNASQECACDTSQALTLAIDVTGRTETFYAGSTELGSVTQSSPLRPDSVSLGVTAAGTSTQGGQAIFANFAVVAV